MGQGFIGALYFDDFLDPWVQMARVGQRVAQARFRDDEQEITSALEVEAFELSRVCGWHDVWLRDLAPEDLRAAFRDALCERVGVVLPLARAVWEEAFEQGRELGRCDVGATDDEE